MTGISLDIHFPSSKAEVRAFAYKAASHLTEPLCMVREYIVKMQIVDEIPPHPRLYKLLSGDAKLTRLAEKCYLSMGIAFFGLLSPLALLGIGIRFIVSNLENEKFIHYLGDLPEKHLAEDKFTFLQWNICGIKAGYEIGEGGQMPLRESLLEIKETRLQKIVDKLLELDADVISLNELFDINDFAYIAGKLRGRYAHMIGNCGGRSIGPNSGLALFSKFKVEEISFEPFPKEMLVSGAKYCEKGLLKATIRDGKNLISDVFLTHLQHSEEPELKEPFFSSASAEVSARAEGIALVKAKVDSSSAHSIILAGDLNMDDDEFQRADPEFYSRFRKVVGYREGLTWPGDEWYVGYTNRWSLLFGKNQEPRKPSGPVNLDHVMVDGAGIKTSLIETGYDPKSPPSRESTSDHKILLSEITMDRRIEDSHFLI